VRTKSYATFLGVLVAALAGGAAALNSCRASEAGGTPSSALVAADPRLSEIRTEIAERVAKGEFPSLSVGVIQNGVVLWEESFGWANRAARREATPHTAYGLASLGKSIAATATLTLVDAGRLSLDTSAASYLGANTLRLYEGSAAPTIRQLLKMTSGVPHGGLAFNSAADAEDYRRRDFLARRAIIVFPPGEVFHYSNMSIGILEPLVERVNGKTYSAFVAAHVFHPLGMGDAYVGERFGSRRQAVQYSVAGTELRTYSVPQSSLATYASVDDLVKFGAFHAKTPLAGQRRILSDRTLDEMHHSRSSPSARIALGIASLDLDDGRLWLLSDGQAGGMQSIISIVPSAGIAVVCLANVTGGQMMEFALRITDSLVPGFLEAAIKRVERAEMEIGQPYKFTPAIAGDWTGTIRAEMREIPIVLTFQNDGNIQVEFDGAQKAPLGNPRYEDGLLIGTFTGALPLEEASQEPHPIELGLRLVGTRMYGIAAAQFSNERGAFTLPTYVSLTRRDSGAR
jgi:CubicO group peptidase (beta-lactamase class C family)